MANRQFKPGFRISWLDVAVLCAGAGGAIGLARTMPSIAEVIAMAIGHFFLFCNVFRIPRTPELFWAAAFLLLCGATILTGQPGWPATFIASIVLSSGLIWRETKRPSYHGVFWQRWNPGLPEWWEVGRQER